MTSIEDCTLKDFLTLEQFHTFQLYIIQLLLWKQASLERHIENFTWKENEKASVICIFCSGC